jgi:hypothetical protein
VLSALTLHQSHESGDKAVQGGSVVALTSNYLKLLLPDSRILPNTLVDARVRQVHAGQLFGTPLNQDFHPV